MPTPFRFRNPGRLVDGDLQLVLVKRTPADPVKNHSPAYTFEMRKAGKKRKIGGIRLRIGRQRSLAGYCGHIGYNVDKKYRGHRYAARSCQLLFPCAYAHGVRTLWITCDPKNLASRRTCELAGGIYVNTVRVPKGTELYASGRRRVRRYRFALVKLQNVESGIRNQEGERSRTALLASGFIRYWAPGPWRRLGQVPARTSRRSGRTCGTKW